MTMAITIACIAAAFVTGSAGSPWWTLMLLIIGLAYEMSKRLELIR
jgi:hypothetical protein